VLFRSYPTHAEAEAAANDNTTIKVRFFISVISEPLSGGVRPECRRALESQNYTTAELGKSLPFLRLSLLSSEPALQFRRRFHRSATTSAVCG
jgi:hypothetical protein